VLLERTRSPSAPRLETAPRVRQRQKRLSEEERAEVARRYEAGDTMAALASSFGCHRDAIRRVLKSERAELRSWRTKVADPARVVALYESGQTAAQIAAGFGVSATAVLNHLRSAGAVLRPRGYVPRGPGGAADHRRRMSNTSRVRAIPRRPRPQERTRSILREEQSRLERERRSSRFP
jgi:uncharacterized protein (DUF433 family)